MTLKLKHLSFKSDDRYRKVYDAILSGDATVADQAHRLHRKASRQALVDTLQQSGLKRI